MHRYTQSKEQIRREWLRYKRKKKYKRQKNYDIPDNSEPWLPSTPKTIQDLISICNEIEKMDLKWKNTLNNL